VKLNVSDKRLLGYEWSYMTMGHSEKLQIELMARGLESHAVQLLERAKLLRDVGYL
jgi:hypothetical protein